MSNTEALQLFEDQPIRTAWDAEAEEWYFSIVDVVGVLTESSNPNNYWKVLKKRLLDEGNELVTNCNQLKLKSTKDGKRYNTDVADTEQLLRIIQSIPSKKAEPFKLWLAQVGKERIEETLDPELIAERMIATYERKGYTRELSQEEQPQGFEQSKKIAQAGGSIAGNARKDLEAHLGRSVITSNGATQLNHIVTQMIEASVQVSNSDKADEE